MDAARQVLYVILALIIVYMVLAFIVHYLDFGWKMVTGDWLHDSLPFLKKMRFGFFNRLLILLFLTILIYGGLSDFLKILPEEWGRLDEAGKIQPYRRPLASVLALAIAGISLYAFGVADEFFEEKNNRKPGD